jgi:hypothetical protein
MKLRAISLFLLLILSISFIEVAAADLYASEITKKDSVYKNTGKEKLTAEQRKINDLEKEMENYRVSAYQSVIT